ncbi:MAG: sugar ABC transporter ATP-binding protein, partial [Planctomycetaceae bacterium]|nr:sugar ABC transporter ATP-binding protein [Planctomycetaceae bacterium]
MSTSPPPTSVQAPSLQMQGICKQFGSTRALHDVSLEVHPGQVLALIGENGAGKSTLMKILSGSLTPDAGTITLAGEPYHPANPHAARMLGVSMIYQELTIAPDLSLEDNLLLGTESSHWGILNRKEQGKRIAKAQELLGLKDIPRDYPARLLSPAQQQLIEIGRTLVNDSRVVIFDEPTSSLTFEDLEHLFHVIGLLREAGLAIVYISHFLEEIRQVCQEFVVLRDGLRVGAGSLEKTTDPEIVQMMIGRELTELFPTVPRTPGEVIVKAKEVSGVQSPHAVSLELRRGEIVGIAGLIGAGRTELARCLFGLDELHGGEILIHDRPTPHSPTDRIRAGMGMVSEDRKTEGLAQNLSITENMTLSHLVPYQRWG